MAGTMKVLLTGDITGSRNGQAWPPAGTEVELPEDEALGLIASGMARGGDVDAEKRRAAALGAVDEVTAAQVKAATSTRERQAVSKRAHEPLNLGAAAELQPVEDDNGPRLPEVNGAIAAKVADPSTPTETPEDPTGETAPPVVEGEDPPKPVKMKAAPVDKPAGK